MSKVTVAATQMACSWDREANLARAEKLIREAAGRGANVVLIQELFETPYFCKDHATRYFDLAKPLEGHPAVEHSRGHARELDVVLPVSVFEHANNAFYNSVVIVDAGGEVLGSYRKSHIPEGPGYHEKYYFSPGDTGFKVFKTKFAKLGVAICWDQWFPETARAMALMGAEILMFPTAIGSEPQDPSLDSAAHWQRTMQGHAAANVMPLVASNRIGVEEGACFAMAAPTSIIRCCRSMDAPEVRALPTDLVFVDLETTGGNAAHHRIIEIGIVRLRDGVVLEEWNTLVHPECAIPPYIESFTGISNEMVRTAPRFADIGRTVLEKLKPAGAAPVFVAHNARFDYGFLRAEFRRAELPFCAPVLCTVKLSRRLFPQELRHNLDTVMARHGLSCSARHRALGDAQVIRDFWITLRRDLPVHTLAEAVQAALGNAKLPPQL